MKPIPTYYLAPGEQEVRNLVEEWGSRYGAGLGRGLTLLYRLRGQQLDKDAVWILPTSWTVGRDEKRAESVFGVPARYADVEQPYLALPFDS